MIYQLEDRRVRLRGETHFIAPSAALIGSVELGDRCSVWFNAVLRGDMDPITVGERTSIQDGAVVHTDPGFPARIGDGVTVGHQAVLHGCTVGSGSLVGIRAVVMNGAEIGECSIIGAGALVTEGKVIPPRSLVLGSPGRVVREVTAEELALLEGYAAEYVERVERYGRSFCPQL